MVNVLNYKDNWIGYLVRLKKTTNFVMRVLGSLGNDLTCNSCDLLVPGSPQSRMLMSALGNGILEQNLQRREDNDNRFDKGNYAANKQTKLKSVICSHLNLPRPACEKSLFVPPNN